MDSVERGNGSGRHYDESAKGRLLATDQESHVRFCKITLARMTVLFYTWLKGNEEKDLALVKQTTKDSSLPEFRLDKNVRRESI